MNCIYYVKQLCWYQNTNFADVMNCKGDMFTPDLLLIVPLKNQYKIAFIAEHHVKLLAKSLKKNKKLDMLVEIFKYAVIFELSEVAEAYQLTKDYKLIARY